MTVAHVTAPRTGVDHWQAKAGRTIAGYALPLITVVVIVVSSLTTDGFAEATNFRAILISTAITGIAAVGMTAITLTGNFFSLGIGPTIILSGISFLALSERTGSAWPAIALTLLLAIAIGVIQALIVSAGLNPVITTLAFGAIIYGCVAIGSDGEVVTAGPVQITWLATTRLAGLPLPVIVFGLLTLAASVLTSRTVMGRRMALLGMNRDTALTSGISVVAATLAAFIIMSIGAGLAGVFSAAQLRQMQANDLPTLTMDVIAAVLVGGAAIAGGEASPARSALGALLIVTLGNVMLLHGLQPGVRVFGVGVVVVLLVVSVHLLKKVASS